MFYLRKQYTYRNEESGEGDGGSSGESQNEQQTTQNTEIEEKARKMGWTPKDEFKGSPDKWRDAAEFVERGENMLPIMKKNLERSERKIAELERSMKDFAEYHTKTEQRMYEKAFRELKAKQIQAVSAGDAEAFVEIDKEIAELNKDAASRQKPQEQGTHPDYAEWVKDNRWAEDDPELAEEAELQAIYLRNKGSKLEGLDFLAAVAKRVKERRPEKFSNPRRNAAPSVEGATAVSKKGGKTFADMPREAREKCEQMEKRYGIKRAEYVKTYFEEE